MRTLISIFIGTVIFGAVPVPIAWATPQVKAHKTTLWAQTDLRSPYRPYRKPVKPNKPGTATNQANAIPTTLVKTNPSHWWPGRPACAGAKGGKGSDGHPCK